MHPPQLPLVDYGSESDDEDESVVAAAVRRPPNEEELEDDFLRTRHDWERELAAAAEAEKKTLKKANAGR